MLEQYIDRSGFIHRTNARVKILFTLVFILLVNLSSDSAWPAFILFFSLVLSLGLISRVGILHLIRRSLLALPFLISAMPLIFWGPDPHIQYKLWDGLILTISPAGITHCTGIMIKAWLSILAAVMMTATTKFSDLMIGFRRLGIPAILVSIIELMWRYLFVIVDEVTRMIRARNSRSSSINGKHHKGGSVFWRGQVTGNMAGSLFLRSLERSERVYEAMLSRGYNGEPLQESIETLTKTQRSIIALSSILLLLVYFIGIITGR